MFALGQIPRIVIKLLTFSGNTYKGRKLESHFIKMNFHRQHQVQVLALEIDKNNVYI